MRAGVLQGAVLQPYFAAHPQVNNQKRFVIEFNQQVFGSTTNLKYGSVAQVFCKVGGEGNTQVRSEERYILDRHVDQSGFETSADGFNFRQFGHKRNSAIFSAGMQ